MKKINHIHWNLSLFKQINRLYKLQSSTITVKKPKLAQTYNDVKSINWESNQCENKPNTGVNIDSFISCKKNGKKEKKNWNWKQECDITWFDS